MYSPHIKYGYSAISDRVIGTRFELVLPPWKGGVLATWLTDHNRHKTVSNNVFRAMRCTISFRRMIAKNQPTKLAIVHRTVSFHISVRYHLGWTRTWTAHLKPFDYQFHEASYSGKYLSCHHPTKCYTFGGVQLGHHGIDARIIDSRFSRR